MARGRPGRASVQKKKEELRQRLRELPQWAYAEASGLARTHLIRREELLGITFRGDTVDLFAILPKLHALADAGARGQPPADAEDGDLTGPSSPALERYREERWRLARIERLEREGQLAPLSAIETGARLISSSIRRAQETLQRRFGQAAADVVAEALSDCEAEISRVFSALAGASTDGEPGLSAAGVAGRQGAAAEDDA